MEVSNYVKLLEVCAPILIALIGIIPTVISNRKKTQMSLNAMMGELRQDSATTNEKVDGLARQLTDHIREDQENEVRQARVRILRFYDELCEDRLHSESHFEDVLDDISMYKAYCETHKDFKNSRGEIAMEYIEATYHKVKSKGGFLAHKETDPDGGED